MVFPLLQSSSTYYMFTDEEYNAEIDKKVEEQGEVDDDL